MKKLSVLFLLLFSISLFAQSKHFQFDIGLNQSWFIYDGGDFETNFRPKLSISLNYNFWEFKNVTSSGGIRYYNLGRSVTLNDRTSRINHYLISVPLQLKYKVEIISTDILLNAETSYILTSSVNAPSPIDNIMTERNITNEMHRLLFSIGIGLEYNFNIYDKTFGIKSIFNYGLTNIPKEGTFKYSENTEYVWVNYKARELNVLLSYYF